MATLKDKVDALVTTYLPGATTELEEIPLLEKLSGQVVWEGFSGKLQRDRQRELWSVLRNNLSPQEELALSAILTLTPEEDRTFQEEND